MLNFLNRALEDQQIGIGSRFNYDEEQRISISKEIHLPTLFIPSTRDFAIPISVEMHANTHKYVSDLTVRVLEAGHFIQAEVPEEVNKNIEEWLNVQQSKKQPQL